MHAVGRAEWIRAHVEVLEDVECDQRREPLSVRWDLEQLVAPIVCGDWLHPRRPMLCKVLEAVNPAVGSRERDDLLRDLAAIELVRATDADGSQAARQGRDPKPFSEA